MTYGAHPALDTLTAEENECDLEDATDQDSYYVSALADSVAQGVRNMFCMFIHAEHVPGRKLSMWTWSPGGPSIPAIGSKTGQSSSH